MQTNTSITIINAVFNEEKGYDDYQATVLQDAWWYGQNKTAVENDGLKSAKLYKIRIPEFSAFLTPVQFKNSETPANFWTVQTGDKIVRGEVTGAFEFAKLEEHFDEVATIIDWHDNQLGGTPHIYIEGK